MMRFTWMVVVGLSTLVACTKTDESCGEEYALADDGNCYPTAQVNLDAVGDEEEDAETEFVVASFSLLFLSKTTFTGTAIDEGSA